MLIDLDGADAQDYYQCTMLVKERTGMAAETTSTDRRIDDLRDDVNNQLDAIREDIRQIRNWMFAGGIALVATMIATLLNIFVGS